MGSPKNSGCPPASLPSAANSSNSENIRLLVVGAGTRLIRLGRWRTQGPDDLGSRTENSACGAHRIFGVVLGLIVDLEQLLPVEYQFFAAKTCQIVDGSEFDGVDRAGLFTHSAINAAKFVDLELCGILVAVFPGG